MKKFLALTVSAAILGALLTGCGGSSAGNESAGTQSASETNVGEVQSTVTIKYYLPGNQPKDYETVAAEINKKLKEDKVGVQLERNYVPFDAWQQKINIMLSTGDEFDMFQVMNDQTPLSSYIAKNALADLTEPFNQYGENIRKVVPESIFSGASVENKLYGIPTYWYETGTQGGFDIRLDVLKKYNLEVPKTPDELLKAAEVIIKNWDGANKPYWANFTSGTDINEMPTHRTYDSWPFCIKDGLFYCDADGNIKSWYETPEFKKDSEFMKKAYGIGLVHPDILVLKSEQSVAIANNGDWFMSAGLGTQSYANMKKNNPNATNQDVVPVFFNPEKQYVRPYTVKNANAVPINSKHPEAAVKFVNWLWANQENYDLYFYGIENKHHKKVGEHGIERIVDPNNNNSPTYKDWDWMSGNINFLRYDDVNGFPADNKMIYTANESAVNIPVANFQFDASKVQTEYANVKTQAQAVMLPIYLGLQDYDKAYDAALQKLKAAGLDKVIQEYETQFKAWQANGGK